MTISKRDLDSFIDSESYLKQFLKEHEWKAVNLWGCGHTGKYIYGLLSSLNVAIEECYDMRGEGFIGGHEIKKPTWEDISKNTPIIFALNGKPEAYTEIQGNLEHFQIPHLFYGAPIVEDKSKAFRTYRNKHKDEQCVIVGNGPSLNDTPLELLKDQIVFGQNKLFLAFDKIPFRPTYMVSWVGDVVRQCKDYYEELPYPLFVSQEGAQWLDQRNKEYETLVFGPHQQFIFGFNPYEQVCVGHTVTYVSLQLAFFMGFKKVILIGVDHNFQYQGESDKWHVVKEDDPQRHFIKDYFPPGENWQAPNLFQAEAHYNLANAVYTKFGRKVIDATHNGKLKIFEKMDLAGALSYDQ